MNQQILVVSWIKIEWQAIYLGMIALRRGMDKAAEFSEGDAVRIKEGEFASFCGKVVRVHQNNRLTVEGRFEGQSDSGLHTLNVSISVVEKIEGTGNSN